MPAPFASKYVDIDGTILHLLHTGPTTLPDVVPPLDRGRLFVLLHPGGGTAAMWTRTLAALAAAGHSAVAVDLPGHGRSPGLDGLPSIDANAALVARLAEAGRLRPFVLVGHSFGATIALAVAARHAARLAGLVLVSGTAPADLAAAIPVLRDVVRGRAPRPFSPEPFSPSATPAVMREYFTEMVKTDPRVQLTDFEAAHGFDCGALAGAVRVPALVVAGADDRLTPPASCEALARAIAGARLEVVAGAGHLVPQEQPDAFAAVLERFVGALA